MNYNLFPSMKAIQMYERLSEQSFLKLDDTPDNLIIFLYCVLCAHPENNFHMTYNYALENFFPKHIESLMGRFVGEMEYINQFKKEEKKDDSSINTEEKSSPNEEEPLFLSSLIPILTSDCGLDINYVMNELPYTEIESFINYNVSKKREMMEEQRFWTFLTICPHIDSDKIKGPEDLFEFSWETNERKETSKKKMEADRQRLIELGFIKENKTEDSSI